MANASAAQSGSPALLARLCFRVPPGRMAALADQYAAETARLLRQHGFAACCAAGWPRAPAAGVVDYFFAFPSLTAFWSARQALEAAPAWRESLQRPGAACTVAGPLAHRLEIVKTVAGPGQTELIGRGRRLGLWHSYSLRDHLPSVSLNGVVQDRLRPHGATVTFRAVYPAIGWRVAPPTGGARQEQTSLRLLCCNLVLYLALLTALPAVPLRHRALMACSGLPLLFALHVGDLLLMVESRTLTLLRPESYAFWRHFDPWFVAVKCYHSLSVMALRQAPPVLLVLAQCRSIGRDALSLTPRPGTAPALPRPPG
ncbi:MAG: hypothetical protein AB1505_13620 [Candidatus Latescibacterota bacterium]